MYEVNYSYKDEGEPLNAHSVGLTDCEWFGKLAELCSISHSTHTTTD